MARKGYSRKGFFGQTIHYDANGNKIGESTKGFFGQTNHYDASGNKVGESTRGFWGQTNHYDANGNKKGESTRGFFNQINHYDEDGDKIGESTRDFFGGWNHYDWRNECIDGSKYGLDPEDYETENEYNDALEEAMYGWRECYDEYQSTGIDPADYETEDEYVDALKEVLYGWRKSCDREWLIYADPEDYETEDEFIEAVKKEKYAWRNKCIDGSEYGIDPADYETEDEYDEALDEEKYRWRNRYDYNWSVNIDPEDYETEEEYVKAFQEKYGWREKHKEEAAKYGLFVDNFETEEKFLEELEKEKNTWRNDTKSFVDNYIDECNYKIEDEAGEYIAEASAKINIDTNAAQEIYDQLVTSGIDINAFIEELGQSIKRVENDRKQQTVCERYQINRYILKAAKGEARYQLEHISPELSLWSALFRENHFEIKYTIFRDLSMLFDEIFETLTDREVEVLKYRFGFYGKFYTLSEIGGIMGVSHERIRQVEEKALRKMRHPSRSKKLIRVAKYEDIFQTENKMVDFKSIIVKKIEAHLVTHIEPHSWEDYFIGDYDEVHQQKGNSTDGFFQDVLRRNELDIVIGDSVTEEDAEAIVFSKNLAGKNAKNIFLEDLPFSIRTYRFMKRSHANTMADLLKMTEDDLARVRDLGNEDAEEVREVVRQYKAGELRIADKKTEDIPLEDLGFGTRAYCSMKRYGANTMADLLKMTEDDILKVRNLGRKSAEEVIEVIRQYGAGELRAVRKDANDILLEDLGFNHRISKCLAKFGVRTMSDLLDMTQDDFCRTSLMKLGGICANEVREVVRQYKAGELRIVPDMTSTQKYILVKIIYKGNERVYKFAQMSTSTLSECIYEVLAKEYSKTGTILDYKMSMELKFLLLLKGYFFMENIMGDFELIIEELIKNDYAKYAEELKYIRKQLKDFSDNELYPEVSIMTVRNKIAQNIIKRNPKTRDELLNCIKTGNDEYDQVLKQKIIEECPNHFTIEVAEDDLLNDSKDSE